jgi:hypothetical protein
MGCPLNSDHNGLLSSKLSGYLKRERVCISIPPHLLGDATYSEPKNKKNKRIYDLLACLVFVYCIISLSSIIAFNCNTIHAWTAIRFSSISIPIIHVIG